jgi:hypothetical protein
VWADDGEGRRRGRTPLQRKTEAWAVERAGAVRERARQRATPTPQQAQVHRPFSAAELLRAGGSQPRRGAAARGHPASARVRPTLRRAEAAGVEAAPAPRAGKPPVGSVALAAQQSFLRRGGGATASDPAAQRARPARFQTTCDGAGAARMCPMIGLARGSYRSSMHLRVVVGVRDVPGALAGSVDTVRRVGRNGMHRSVPLDEIDSVRISISTPYPSWGGRANFPHRSEDKSKWLHSEGWRRYGKAPPMEGASRGIGGGPAEVCARLSGRARAHAPVNRPAGFLCWLQTRG